MAAFTKAPPPRPALNTLGHGSKPSPGLPERQRPPAMRVVFVFAQFMCTGKKMPAAAQKIRCAGAA
ncbi:hypothetical protein CNY67_01085 [Desulfovibrio sp. G11]|nr:hypothetical protein CNY67_01085 [Desulfovibrio sp. G11]